jgi:sugar/nucleoside kinase (ribokinase family)
MKSRKKFKISGTGCALVDYLYNPVNFSDAGFQNYISKDPGDGGLAPGKLVFTEEFERFANKPYAQVREKLTNRKAPAAFNIGGPSIVSLIHTAQMLNDLPAEVVFYGCKGNDEAGAFIDKMLAKTPLKVGYYKVGNGFTPYTDVLCDPQYDSGHGERIFINNIGAAWDFFPIDLDDSFFSSDVVVFGGTALVPNLHVNLLELLEKSKKSGALTIVNTVYDFLNEKRDPSKPWPMGSSDKSYENIDLLIMDIEEAFRLSGTQDINDSLLYFKDRKVGAAVITHGPNPVHIYSNHRFLGSIAHLEMPVSEKVKSELREKGPSGDTTGCGDNFTGGVIASISKQMIENPNSTVDLVKAVAFGIASGGFTCFYNGGTYYEKKPGEKSKLVEDYFAHYLNQIDCEL